MHGHSPVSWAAALFDPTVDADGDGVDTPTARPAIFRGALGEDTGRRQMPPPHPDARCRPRLHPLLVGRCGLTEVRHEGLEEVSQLLVGVAFPSRRCQQLH